MGYPINRSYENRTPNKSVRTGDTLPLAFVVLHETAGFGSLNWLLRRDVRASYTHIITRDGIVWPYVDASRYYAWHAGVKSAWTVGGRRYVGGEINQASYGVSVEGLNNGTPITRAQRDSLIELLAELSAKHDLPLNATSFPTHAQVAPGYKTDPRGFDQGEILRLAGEYLESLRAPTFQAWTVTTDAANIRQGPSVLLPVAGVFRRGESFRSRRLVKGQAINQNDQWAWLEDGRGFVHTSVITPKREPITVPDPLPVQGDPRISLELWTRILAEHQSPCVGDAAALYQICREWTIDPAVALAFFADSGFGVGPVGVTAKNWGRVVEPFNPSRSNGRYRLGDTWIAMYPTWQAGLIDWCERIVRRYVETRGADTLEAIAPIYRPGDSAFVGEKRARIVAWVAEENALRGA